MSVWMKVRGSTIVEKLKVEAYDLIRRINGDIAIFAKENRAPNNHHSHSPLTTTLHKRMAPTKPTNVLVVDDLPEKLLVYRTVSAGRLKPRHGRFR